MTSTPKTPEFPFMVFAEMVPEAASLNDPRTPNDEKARIGWKIEDTLDVVHNIASRNTQRGRHESNHRVRDAVMKGLVRNARGKPIRGEPSRLAALHGLPVTKIRKWIEQLSHQRGNVEAADDWRTVVYGKMLRRQNSYAARQRTKKRD